MLYILKRMNDVITIIDFMNDGNVYKFRQDLLAPELAPLHNPKDHDWLKHWWKRRSIPINQGHIKDMLERKGLLGPEDYLLKNLGLSLTDYYWIAPLDSDLRWEDVNLFDNNFHGNIIIGELEGDEFDNLPHYTPNGSLQGSLEKSWMILNGERGLLKGNRGVLSTESINEVIASRLHKLQGFDNYTEYKLIKMNGRDYDYGCYSRLFTSKELEAVSAYDIICSEKQSNEVSTFEHFIQVCVRHGLEEEKLRLFLDYMILTDFILSNRDRHMSNVAILRDAETLEFVKPAPIYDSGNCLFVHDSVPVGKKGLLSIETESFAKNELNMLKLVSDRSCVDITKLPPRSYIEDIYHMDSQMDESRITLIGEAYERKIELFRRYQMGEDLNQVKRAIKGIHPQSPVLEDVVISDI